MKNKKYILYIIISIFIVFFASIFVSEKKYIDNVNGRQEKHYESCVDYRETGVYSNKNNWTEEFLEYSKPWEECEKILEYKSITFSADYIFNNSLFRYTIFLAIGAIILCTMPFILSITEIFKSKQVKSRLLRMDYKKFVKNLFKEAYKYIWIVPVCLTLFLLFCYIYSGHFDCRYNLDGGMCDLRLVTNPLFYLIYILVILLNIGIYTNIALTVMSQNKNTILCVVETLLLSILWIFITEIIGVQLNNMNILNQEYFSPINIYLHSHYIGLNIYVQLLLYVVWYIFSLVMALLSYKNKEKLIHMCEK